jgi:hypothetical protein
MEDELDLDETQEISTEKVSEYDKDSCSFISDTLEMESMGTLFKCCQCGSLKNAVNLMPSYTQTNSTGQQQWICGSCQSRQQQYIVAQAKFEKAQTMFLVRSNSEKSQWVPEHQVNIYALEHFRSSSLKLWFDASPFRSLQQSSHKDSPDPLNVRQGYLPYDEPLSLDPHNIEEEESTQLFEPKLESSKSGSQKKKRKERFDINQVVLDPSPLKIRKRNRQIVVPSWREISEDIEVNGVSDNNNSSEEDTSNEFYESLHKTFETPPDPPKKKKKKPSRKKKRPSPKRSDKGPEINEYTQLMLDEE